MPTIEQVEKELTEDREQEAKILEGLQKIVNQIIYLDSYISEKGEKSMERLRAFVNEQFADFQNFAELILVLKVFDSENMAETAMDIMQSFTENKNLVVNDEPIALYIEKKLREGKIIDSVQEHITPSLIEVFTSVLEHIKAQKNGNTSKNEFLALKTTNKKAFDALNYGIKPFLEILSLDEISFMQELLKDSNGIPMESFIWDMVSLISLRFENISSLDELSEKQRGAIYYLNKFTTSFLRNHLAWAYEQIRQALHDEDQDKKTTPGSHQQVFEQRTLLPDDLQKEIDDTIEDIQQGNLMGWRIFYADNRSLDSSHVAEIGGKSLTEREQALQEFFVQEGISATIKPGSIIRALEWIVGVPEEVEQVRMTKAIEGKVFKKVKRGKARIFYILDRDQEIIVFFTHQKKDWAYGF